MAFLRKFGFGGVLADDMGLGKTVQVLALLEARRRERVEAEGANGAPSTTIPSPSLVVAPRSLVFNWKAEAEKFSPALKVLDHTAVDPGSVGRSFPELRPGAHDLRHASPGHVVLQRCALRLRDSRRSPGDQKPGERVGQSGSAGDGRPSPGAVGHAGAEPSGRTLEFVRLSEPGDDGIARRVQRAQRRRGQSRRLGTRAARQIASPVHPPPNQGTGRQRPS